MFKTLIKYSYKMFEQYHRSISNYLKSDRTDPFTIIVEGNIGSGKTSFLNHFKYNNNIVTITEPVKLWQNVKGYNLLELMYKDHSKWGFTFQTYVQLTMLQIHELKVDKPIKMMERSIYSARYCFLENLYQNGSMPEAQKIVLDEWFKWILKRDAVKCDLIVYLRTTPEVVAERIKKRSRNEEKHVPIEYLQKLHELHEDWLLNKTKFTVPTPVLVFDANKDLKELKVQYQNCEEQMNCDLVQSKIL